MLKLFLKDIKGIKNIPKDGPFIITANHESYLDPFLVWSIITPHLDKKIHFLANKGRFWDLFGDKISRDWLGCVPLDEGKEKALDEMLAMVKKKEIVALFIEGPRSLDGKLQKGKTGVIRLALKGRVPVLPIGMIGSYEIAPGEKIVPRFKRASLKIGKLMYFDKHYRKRMGKKLLRKLTSDVMHEISRLTGKSYDY